MASENTHCLVRINFYTQAHVFVMNSEEQKIYDYCIRQGAKNQLGMFVENRGSIAMILKIDHDTCYNFFLNYPDVIAFDPVEHLIWVKKFYSEVDFGLSKELWMQKKDRKTEEIKTILNRNALFQKNNFIQKITSVLKTDFRQYKNHPFIAEWAKKNRLLFEMLNDDVKSVKGNKYNLDDILKLST